MKNWTWKEWTALGLVVAVLIAEIVSVFVAPWAALLGACTGVLSFIAGYIAGKHIVIKQAEEEVKTTKKENE